jgi:hypothetical protein
MKKCTVSLLTCTLFSFIFFHQSVQGIDLIREDTIDNVFVPPMGFDDNDHIQIVLDGRLPNLCFELANSYYHIDQKEKIITVKQFIKKKQIPECQEKHDKLPAYLKWPEPFTTEINLGTLSKGDYKIQFQSSTGAAKEKLFHVKTSESSSIDEMLYAPISDAFIPELIYETDNGEFILTGIWQNSCLDLKNEDITVQKFSDVFVVLPKMTVTKQAHCFNKQRPLREIVSLGELKQGRYLLHIRSLTGRSVNKIFTVIKNDLDPRMDTL